MGALASIFGVLSGLGQTGEQLAGAREINRQKALEHLALLQQQQAQKMAQQEQVQRLANEQLSNRRTEQQLQSGRQPLMLGNPFTSGGKQYARFQDPMTGALSVKELPGGTPETPEETMFRGLVAIGRPRDEAAAAVVKKLTGKTTLKKETQPDKDSATGFSDVYYDDTGTEAWRTEALPSRYLIPTQTTGSSTDPFGLITKHTSTRSPIIPGVNAPAGTAPAGAPAAGSPRVAPPTTQTPRGGEAGPTGGGSQTMAVPNPPGLVERGNLPIWNRPTVRNADGTHSSEYSTSFQDEQGREVLVPTVVNGRFLTPDGKKPPVGSPAEKAMFQNAWQHYLQTGQNLGKFDSPASADAYAGILHNRGAKPPSSSIPTGGPVGPLSVGTYQGLMPDQTIPPRPGLNPLVQQMANDILQGRDVTKLQPAKARPLAESLARAYGWKGQGSLTPAQQMQIEQVDNALAQLSDPKMLKLFDSPGLSLTMAMVPLDPTGEGGFAGLKAGLGRRLIPQEAATYLDTLTRLRGVITGIRSFTGANNSNATADRLLAELPTFTNTKNSQDAQVKLSRLRQEVSIIKRLGYFLPDQQAPTGNLPPPPTGGANGNNPLGLELPSGR